MLALDKPGPMSIMTLCCQVTTDRCHTDWCWLIASPEKEKERRKEHGSRVLLVMALVLIQNVSQFLGSC